ncbi:MAG: hypothetical protein JSV01_04920 [Desulfobacterales bacterium]|nr:MAG: hypothetical protein JSV01_04920 [Desulfobacterales bacterium]
MREIREYVMITIGALIITFVPWTNSWADGDWEFRFVPFLWASSLTGELGPKTRPATVNMDFSDLFEMTEAGFTGEIDATYKEDWWFAVEGQYLELEEKGTGPGGARVKADVTFGIASFVVGKRLIQNIDVYTGGRYLHMDTDVSLTGVPTIGKKEEWVDPIIGFRIRADATEKLFIRFGMDVGGFGVNSDFTYAFLSNVNYAFNDRYSAIFGYRMLDVEYDKGGFLFDAKMDGLLLGLAITF